MNISFEFRAKNVDFDPEIILLKDCKKPISAILGKIRNSLFFGIFKIQNLLSNWVLKVKVTTIRVFHKVDFLKKKNEDLEQCVTAN